MPFLCSMASQTDRIALLEQHLTANRLERLREVLAMRTRRLTLVLENLYHPENANGVLRTAECVGLQEVHLIQEKFAWKYNRNIARGSGKWLEVGEWSEADTCYTRLKQQGYALVATSAAPGSLAPDALPLDRPLAIIFGNESVGVTEKALSLCDYRVHIPMAGLTESYNIGVSAGILLYELTQRIRSQSPEKWQLPTSDAQDVYEDWLKKAVKFAGPLLESINKLQ
jgi:tRNA (guanosine-2'-O-)-methyltransferase